MKSIECRLIFCGKYKEIPVGSFSSISKAKQFVKKCWAGPYYIVRTKKEKPCI